MDKVARLMRKLACLIDGHQWKISPFRALNALPGEYSVRCERCYKYEHREA